MLKILKTKVSKSSNMHSNGDIFVIPRLTSCLFIPDANALLQERKLTVSELIKLIITVHSENLAL
jgi:hypothetical protein